MSDVEKDIIEQEKQYWQAMVDRDVDKILALTADPCIVTGAQGAMLLDHRTSAPTADVVNVVYTVTENMVVDGKPLTLKAADASTWARQDDRWVCVLHTESILGDPFGRDRKAAPSNGARPATKQRSAAAKRKPQRSVASRRRKVRG
jgi:hypothetical protein